MEFTKETKSGTACRTVRKVLIVICCIMLISVQFMVSAFAYTTIESPFQEPQPTLHTAYLYVGNNTTGKLFMISSPADLKDLYMLASFDGSRWQLSTGSLKDGLSADILVIRYNAVTGVYENSFTIDTDSLKTTTIVQGTSYTQYISYGIPVSDNGTLGMASVRYLSEYDNDLQMIKTAVETLANDIGIITTNITLIKTTCDTIKTQVTQINTVTKAINTKVNNIYTYLETELPNIENYLSLIEDDCTELIQQLKNAVNELKTANYWLEQIYNVINDNNATTIPYENSSNIQEYNSMENELMQDKSFEVESIFQENAGINPNGIAFINNMIQQWALSIPEISSIIIMFLAIGLGVLLLGRKV